MNREFLEISALLDGYKEFLDRLKLHNVEALKQWEIENFEEKLQQIRDNVEIASKEEVTGLEEKKYLKILMNLKS